MRYKLIALMLAAGLAVAGASHAEPVQCPASGIALQLLGSGGPISDDARASSGAVIWINGKSRLLIDAGGGTYLRFGQSGARLEDLDFIGISHFHTDHVADLPAILKGAYFIKSTHAVSLVGPTGNTHFPSMTGFFRAMFGMDLRALRTVHRVLRAASRDTRRDRSGAGRRVGRRRDDGWLCRRDVGVESL